ncbi:MAG: hypothetical protein WBK76_02575 [Candidatus Saccharimonadales bacterium]
MHEFLWVHISVHPFWFIIGLLVCAAAIYFATAAGTLLLAVYLYAVTVWTPLWSWLPDLFWLAVVAALIGLLLGLFAGGAGRSLALGGAVVALLVALILMHGHLFGSKPDVPEGDKVGTTFDQLQQDFDDERTKRIENDNDVREDFDRLQRQNNRQAGRIGSLETEVEELKGRVTTLQELVDDHVHERVDQPHYVDK